MGESGESRLLPRPLVLVRLAGGLKQRLVQLLVRLGNDSGGEVLVHVAAIKQTYQTIRLTGNEDAR